MPRRMLHNTMEEARDEKKQRVVEEKQRRSDSPGGFEVKGGEQEIS